MHGGAQASQVVVQADSQQFDHAAVEQEPAVGVPRRGADAEAGHGAVGDPAAVAHGRLQGVQVGVGDVPAARLAYAQGAVGTPRHGAAAGVQDAVRDGVFRPGGGVHLRAHHHGSLRVRDVRRRHAHAAVGHARGARAHQADVAVDAAAGVPAPAGLDGIVHAHGDDVVLSGRVQQRGDVKVEGAVAIGASAGQPAVDPDLAVHIDAVELHGHALRVRGPEMLAVPADPAGQGSAVDSGRVGPGEFSLDTPVVGEVQAAPGGVVEGGLRLRRVVPEPEQPAEIEVFDRPGRRARQGAGQHQQTSGHKDSFE